MYGLAGHDFETGMEIVQKSYAFMKHQRDFYMKKCNEFRKDDDIARLEKELKRAQGVACLHRFYGDEAKKYYDFRERHYKSCKNGNRYNVKLVDTGLGEGISVECPVCGAVEDITDISTW